MADTSDATVMPSPTANQTQKICSTCGKSIDVMAEICPHCGVRQRTPVSKASLLILTFFFGGLGAHKFYLGKYWQGALYFLFFWAYIPFIIALAEFVGYAFTSTQQLNEKYSAKCSPATVIIAVVVGFVFVAGILASVSLSGFEDYKMRAKASEGLQMAKSLQAKIAEAFSEHPSDMSCDLNSCQLGVSVLGPTKYVRRVSSDKGGTITIEYDEHFLPQSKNVLTISPQVDGIQADLSSPANVGKTVTWKCGGDTLTTVPRNYVPASCR